MKRPGRLGWLVLLLVLVAVLLPGSFGCDKGSSTGETKVTFLQDWEAAKAQAASEGKPIMINFYTDT